MLNLIKNLILKLNKTVRNQQIIKEWEFILKRNNYKLNVKIHLNQIKIVYFIFLFLDLVIRNLVLVILIMNSL